MSNKYFMVTGVYMRKCKLCNESYVSNNIAQKYCTKTCSKKASLIQWNNTRIKRGIKRKKQLIELSGGKCTKCGYNKCMRALCFHHKDEKTKKFTLDTSNLYKYTYQLILNEYQKCELLCQNCHQELHEYLDINNCTKYSNSSKVKLARKRKKFLIEKCGGKCSVCGYKNDNYISSITFHHIDKTVKSTEINILTIRDSFKLVEEELHKTILVCFNCHMELETNL